MKRISAQNRNMKSLSISHNFMKPNLQRVRKGYKSVCLCFNNVCACVCENRTYAFHTISPLPRIISNAQFARHSLYSRFVALSHLLARPPESLGRLSCAFAHDIYCSSRTAFSFYCVSALPSIAWLRLYFTIVVCGWGLFHRFTFFVPLHLRARCVLLAFGFI